MKVYLGDGVYVSWDDDMHMLTLTVENGLQVLETIHLEQHVYSNLVRFVEHMATGGATKHTQVVR